MHHTLLKIFFTITGAICPSADFFEKTLYATTPDNSSSYYTDNRFYTLFQDDLHSNGSTVMEFNTDPNTILADFFVVKLKQVFKLNLLLSSNRLNQKLIPDAHTIPLWLFKLF
jgi:hypothetical protein